MTMLAEAPVPVSAAPESRRWPVPHAGMPPLDTSGNQLSDFEFWPMRRFYWPIALYSLWLMVRYRGITLPTAANPSFPGGGFSGESKSAILDLACASAPAHVAPFIPIDRPARPHDPATEAMEAEAAMGAACLGFPVVAKPDLGCRGAGVRLIRDPGQLTDYLESFPPGARLILQRYVDFEAEAGVFYVRMPGEAKGRIVSLTLKYFPYVYGDGRQAAGRRQHRPDGPSWSPPPPDRCRRNRADPAPRLPGLPVDRPGSRPSPWRTRESRGSGSAGGPWHHRMPDS